MKKVKILLTGLCLLFVSMTAFGMVNSKIIVKLKKTSNNNLRTIPESTISLECYLENNSIELIASGDNVTCDVQIINTLTDEIVYIDSVECIDGVSSYIPSPLEEGNYYIIARTARTIWEGTFDIY